LPFFIKTLKKDIYKIRNASKSIPRSVSTLKKPEVEQLLQNEPDEIPADELLFKIWQFEYIEKGLREF
jgi:hypothetical protein